MSFEMPKTREQHPLNVSIGIWLPNHPLLLALVPPLTLLALIFPILLLPLRPRFTPHKPCGLLMPSNDGSLTLPPASPSPATGLLYDQPANCCCSVCDSVGPSTYESVGASEVNSRSKLAVSRWSTYKTHQQPEETKDKENNLPHWA
jgi:hypothetical protein